MSGRLVQFTPPATPLADWQPSWNLSPGQQLMILRREAGKTQHARVLWKLTPGWLKDLSRAPFSVQAEHLQDKPMLRQPLEQRRCLIPVDGYYLWAERNGRRHPWYLRADQGQLMLAGLWERYQLDDRTFWDSCALISVPALDLAASLATRMPASLDSAGCSLWLASGNTPQALQTLLLNSRHTADIAHPVHPSTSDPARQGPQCCSPTGPLLRRPRNP